MSITPVAFTIRHSDDHSEDGSLEALPGLYDEALLHRGSDEHGDVSLTHLDTAWCLSLHGGDLLVFENLDRNDLGGPWHLRGASKERVIELWTLLAAGRIDELRNCGWKDGYG